MEFSCPHCQKRIEIALPVSRSEACFFCHHDLRCCLFCKHYDAQSSSQCREERADLVTEKSKANFCEYFEFSHKTQQTLDARAAQLRKLNELFAKK